MQKNFRWFGVIIAGLMPLVSVGGCSMINDSPHGTTTTVDFAKYVTAAQAGADFRAESTRLELSPSWSWPNKVTFAANGPDGSPQKYASDYGKSRAQAYWYCSWGDYFLTATGKNRVTALAKLKAVESMDYYRINMSSAVRTYFNKELSQATQGNVSLLSEDIKSNCARGRA